MLIPIYVGQKFTAFQAGDRWIKVHCDKCECDYAYELKRVARGYAHSHYGIGIESAPIKAQAAASQELERQLANEAELVPCPRCHWIDEAAVVKYRRAEFGGCATFLFIIAIPVTLLCLWIGWIISKGPGADRGAAVVMALYVPLVLWITVIFTHVITGILRARFDPNKCYPSEPVVPRGTPTPVMLDRDGGIVEPARKPIAQADRTPSHHVSVDLTNPRLPNVCYHCLDPSTVTTTVTTGAFQVAIPSCTACQSPQLGFQTIALMIAGYSSLFLGLAAAAVSMSKETFDAVCYIVLCAIPVIGVWAIHVVVLLNIRSHVRVHDFDSRRGILKLWFRNAKYVEFIHEFRETIA